MKRTKLLRLASLFLTVLMIAGTFTAVLPVYAADGTGGNSGEGSSTLQQISDALNAISYLEYDEKYADVKRATKTVTIDAADYDAELTDADVKVETNYEGKEGDSLYMPDVGKVT